MLAIWFDEFLQKIVSYFILLTMLGQIRKKHINGNGKGRRARGGIANTMCFQEFFTLRPSLQWLGLGVPGLLLLREPSWTGCQVGCSYLATCKYVWYIDDVCTHCMLNSKWTEQAWEPWSSSLSLVTLPSTLAGRRSSMSQGKPFQNHFHFGNLWKGQ